MKRLLPFLILLLMSFSTNFANGVAVVDAGKGVYLRLDSTFVHVTVEGQIAKTTTIQYFTNTDTSAKIKYAFPMSEQASAIQLRWLVGGAWYKASVAGTPQDTTLPGGGSYVSPGLLNYLGSTPLYFSIPQKIKSDSALAVELTYVEFLPYSFGTVTYSYPADYSLIQPGAIILQKFDLNLYSQRAIDSIKVNGNFLPTLLANYTDSAKVSIIQHEHAADQDYSIKYSLNADQLGLFAYSSMLADSLVPDSLGRGFLSFIAEPDPGNSTATISKVFTLIIDRSGSMYGTKMEQAKDAAKFIVNHLNEGDKFNLIDFDDQITSFRPGHIQYNQQTRDSALAYIDGLYARGSTSISGAFAEAVPQFTSADNNTANIIIFFTDGQPTAGITNISQLVDYIDNLIKTSEKKIFLFSFGIGSDANTQLLTLISLHNNGMSEFLGSDELYSRITDFYLSIRNPVLLNSHISFTPPIVTEVFPDSLPNLYKGKQMIVAGRYNQAQPVKITLSGTAFGKPVSYDYNINLSDTAIAENQFLPKVWAKQKIAALFIRYYTLPQGSEEAIPIKNEIIALSQAYGIVTSFTSFSGSSPTGGSTEVKKDITNRNIQPGDFVLLGNYPNPFNPSTTIRFRVNNNFSGLVSIKIYNILGQVIRILHLQVRGAGIYNITWNGMDGSSQYVPSGIYLYSIEAKNMVLMGKMTLLK